MESPFLTDVFRRFILAILAFLVFEGCGPTTIPTLAESTEIASLNPTFNEVYEAIFKTQCISCHSSRSPVLTSHSSTLASGSVVAYNAEASSLYQSVLTGSMPKGLPPLSNTQLELIKNWINSGALADLPIPNRPDSLSVTSITQSEIEFRWNDVGANESSYLVERSTDQSAYVQVAELQSNVTSFRDTLLSLGTTYYYRVSSKNASGTSSPSEILIVTTLGLPPNPPSELTVTSISESQLKLIWIDNSSDESNFVIERGSSQSGTFSTLTTLPANVNSFTDTNLAPSTTYFYRIFALSENGNSTTTSIVSGTTTQAPVDSNTAPIAPSGLTAGAFSSSQINLNWQDNSDNESGFTIERSNSALSGFTSVANLGVNINSFQDTGLNPTSTYYYRIKAFNNIASSSYSNTANSTTHAATPVAPSGLSIIAVTPTTVQIQWVDNSTNEVGFKVERASTSNGAYSLISTVNAGTTQFTDSNLNSMNTYFYRVKATNTAGDSTPTTSLSATTSANFTWIYNNITQTKCASCHGINSPSGGFSVDTMADVLTRVVAGNAANSTFYQRVADNTMPPGGPLSSTEKTAIQSWINAGALQDQSAPQAPSNLSIGGATSSSLSLSWTDNANNETAYYVERSLSGSGPFTVIATLNANASNFADTGLQANTSYYYKIKVKNITASVASAVANSATLITIPSAPSGLTATATSPTSISISWVDGSTNESGFKVERALTSNGTYSLVCTTASNVTDCIDNTVFENTSYYYRAYSFNAGGNSITTASISATTPSANQSTPPNAPTNLTATATSSSQINIAWTDNSNDESNFKVFRSTTAGGTYSLIATLGVNVVSYQNTGLAASTTYYYKITASNNAGESAQTPSVNATTASPPPQAPTNLVVTANSASTLSLTWTDNSNDETGFKIEKSASSGGPFTTLATLGANVTSYSNAGLSAVTTVYYRVYAYNGNGNSNSTAIASNTTWGTFTWINSNILNPSTNVYKCNNCHAGASPRKGYSTESYSGVMSLVVSGNASGSLMYQRIQDGSMPQAGPLTATEMKAVETWINGGAQNN